MVLVCIAPGLSVACVGQHRTISEVVPAQLIVRAACNGGFSGPGARPVSATTVANWYIKNGSLVYLLFLRGESGWYNRKTEWNYATDSLGQFVQNFAVGDFRYRITLDAQSKRVSLLGTRLNLESVNVGFMDRVADTGFLRGSELHDFCWTSPPDPVDEVLGQSKGSVDFVSHSAILGNAPVPNTR